MNRTDSWWKTYTAHLQGAKQPTNLRNKVRVIDDCVELCQAVGRWAGDYRPVVNAFSNFLDSNGSGSRHVMSLLDASRNQWDASRVAYAMEGLKLAEFLAHYNLTIAERVADERDWAPILRVSGRPASQLPVRLDSDHRWGIVVENIVPARRAANLLAQRHMPGGLTSLPTLPGFQFENDLSFYCVDVEGVWRHYPYTAVTTEQIQGVLRYFIANRTHLATEWLNIKGLVFGSSFDPVRWLRERPTVKQLVREHFHREDLPEDLYIEFESIVLAIAAEISQKAAVTARVTAKQQSLREQIGHDIRKRVQIEVTINSRELDL